MTRLKICGLTRIEDALGAVAVGANYLGLIFAPSSPRRVLATQLDWLDEVRDHAELVGVFQDQEASFVEDTALALDLDFVQLHGSERGDAWRRMPVRVLEASIVAESTVPTARLAGIAWARLLDGGSGSGTSFDWSLAETVARSERLFLAGGLDPNNVGDAVRRLRPFAVDVSSGVESAPGVKDSKLMQAFAEALRKSVADEPAL